jgi:hypothetical protein
MRDAGCVEVRADRYLPAGIDEPGDSGYLDSRRRPGWHRRRTGTLVAARSAAAEATEGFSVTKVQARAMGSDGQRQMASSLGGRVTAVPAGSCQPAGWMPIGQASRCSAPYTAATLSAAGITMNRRDA